MPEALSRRLLLTLPSFGGRMDGCTLRGSCGHFWCPAPHSPSLPDVISARGDHRRTKPTTAYSESGLVLLRPTAGRRLGSSLPLAVPTSSADPRCSQWLRSPFFLRRTR